ncbi:hypothetical protein PRECH8_27080 [Insulibacter thermoxylanivorax]|uniref:Uncharacterized protein n=1 Tax=Insulibacter thermoxylanivorax TaxID=2749268 RepID=A0A916VGH2_9BACL|nr:hypothetical protein PRECH8_27080 [Insulibacter thermoxylanivorax]
MSTKRNNVIQFGKFITALLAEEGVRNTSFIIQFPIKDEKQARHNPSHKTLQTPRSGPHFHIMNNLVNTQNIKENSRDHESFLQRFYLIPQCSK